MRLQRADFLDLADLHLAIGGIDIGALLEAVGQSGSMPQQVDDQHRPRRRPGQEGRRGAGLEDAEVLPFRNVFVDGLVERDAAFLDQHHEGDRGDRLGHRIDAEDGVVLDRRLALEVGKALHRAMDHLAAAVDQKLRPRKAAGIDIAAASDAPRRGRGRPWTCRRIRARRGSGLTSGYLRQAVAVRLDSRKVCPVPTAACLPRAGGWCRLPAQSRTAAGQPKCPNSTTPN